MSMPERTKAGMRGVEPEPGRGVKGRVCWGAAGIVVLGVGVGDWDWDWAEVGVGVGEEVEVGEEDEEAEVGETVETVDVLNVVWVWEAMCRAFRLCLWVFVYGTVTIRLFVRLVSFER